MVHAVAGPCCPRTLAGQGADCLNLNMPDWIEYGNFYYQADIGIRQAYLDARKPENRKQVYALVKDADVFVDNLRPGVADSQGYSAGALAERKPGEHYIFIAANGRYSFKGTGWVRSGRFDRIEILLLDTDCFRGGNLLL